jgi:hypothetical protein
MDRRSNSQGNLLGNYSKVDSRRELEGKCYSKQEPDYERIRQVL